MNQINLIESTNLFHLIILCFVYEKNQRKKKNRFVVNIRNFNVIIQSNVYFLFFQFDIISIVLKCQYIIVLNCFVLFYQ